ncbi:hypothetical protein Anas_14429 [Armadillidium nasatum]|uniref:Uncharacterized protein n=1 Tax=Armadillidium nasatum TaxID=96803 RepID=A0A5N5T0Z6_9CRUS|nr:hypothetical protein Anas_14429 [Armadillidium nasatum]
MWQEREVTLIHNTIRRIEYTVDLSETLPIHDLETVARTMVIDVVGYTSSFKCTVAAEAKIKDTYSWHNLTQHTITEQINVGQIAERLELVDETLSKTLIIKFIIIINDLLRNMSEVCSGYEIRTPYKGER